MARAVVVNNNFRINEECSVIVLLNSPGDSALQWGVGRGFLSLSTALLCVLMCCFNRHTLVWHGTAKFAFCSFFWLQISELSDCGTDRRKILRDVHVSRSPVCVFSPLGRCPRGSQIRNPPPPCGGYCVLLMQFRFFDFSFLQITYQINKLVFCFI